MDAMKIGVCATVQEAVENRFAEDGARWKTSPDDMKVSRVSQAVTRIRINTDKGPRYFSVSVKEDL